jgi:glucan-binding YG repeat protein
MDSLAMFFGAKKKKSPTKAKKSHGSIVVGGKTKKLYQGKNGGLYYKTKSGKTYVDAKFVRKHSPKKARKSPKRTRKSPKRTRKSPKRTRKSPKRTRKSPKRSRKSPKRTMRKTRWGYGFGMPSLSDMMGPASLMSPQFTYPSM